MYYNAYFPGGQIGMRPPLTMNGQVDYADGTEASISQMAKDVTHFLTWVAEPRHDERKKMGVKAMILMAIAAVPALYAKRLKWSVLKGRQVSFRRTW